MYLKAKHKFLALNMYLCIVSFQKKFSAKILILLGQAKIEHFRNWQLKDRFPTLFRYNSILKMSTWCDNSQWTHCF